MGCSSSDTADVEDRYVQDGKMLNKSLIKDGINENKVINGDGDASDIINLGKCTYYDNQKHKFINNICHCGEVVEIIEEDDEEYDYDGGVLCPISETGNHHFDSLAVCKYCNTIRSKRISIVKRRTTTMSVLNLESKRISKKNTLLQLHVVNEDLEGNSGNNLLKSKHMSMINLDLSSKKTNEEDATIKEPKIDYIQIQGGSQ